MINVKDYGAKGDGISDDTIFIDDAIKAADTLKTSIKFPSGKYMVRELYPGCGYAIFNPGISMIGEGKIDSIIAPLPDMPDTADFILIKPSNGSDISYLELGRFLVYPGASGTKYGKRCIFMDFINNTNLSELHMHDVYLASSNNDYSFEIANNMAVNYQGVPANSTIERCEFWEGSKLIGIGDSNSIHNNIFRSSNGSGREGIKLYHIDSSGGVSSHTIISENNFDCDGGSLYAIRGRNIKFNYNNVEQSHGTGTVNGAIIDIDGSSGVIPWSEINGNHIGVFGTSTVNSAIRIHGTINAMIDNNTLLAGISVNNGILITNSANNACLGRNGINSNFITPINNNGLITSGINYILPLYNGWSNIGLGTSPMSCLISRENIVFIEGFLIPPFTPNNTIITILPNGFRPLKIQRFICYATINNAVSSAVIEIQTDGTIYYFGDNSTQVSLSGISFTTQSYILNTY